MDKGKDQLLFPYTYISYCPCGTPIIPATLIEMWTWLLKCGQKVNLLFVNHVIITYWPEKSKRKFTLLKYSFFFFFFFLRRTVTYVNLFSSNSIFRGYVLWKFTLSNLIILVEDLIRWKRDFEIFLIGYYAGDIRNKNITGKY